MFSFETDGSKAALSLLNIVLLVIPLVSIVSGTMYLYNSREYIEMVLCQPIHRSTLFWGIFMGTSIPLATSFAAGIAVPFLIFSSSINFYDLLILLCIGVILTFVFCAIAFLVSALFEDKSRGLGFAIFIWLFVGIIYDGLLLFIIYYLQDYPIEIPVLILTILNPIDLSRVFFMLNFDISALMGYTGALFQKFFGSTAGLLISAASVILWIAVPAVLSFRRFIKKDF